MSPATWHYTGYVQKSQLPGTAELDWIQERYIYCVGCLISQFVEDMQYEQTPVPEKKNCNPHLLFKLPMHPQKNALLCCCIPIPCFLPSGDHLYSHKPCTTRLTCLRPQLCRFLQRLGRCRVHVLNLLDQKLSLVNELFIFGPIFQKMLQELQKSFTIYQKDLLDGNGFMGICYENFEDVKAFILDHFAFVSEEIHTYF